MELIQISNVTSKNVAARKTIRFTQSICPYCNMILDAEVFERDGKVFMTKTVCIINIFSCRRPWISLCVFTKVGNYRIEMNVPVNMDK